MESSETKFVSLYDYLGHAAGKELGSQCEKFHRYMNLPSSYKNVKNNNYTGKIKTYKHSNIEKFFKVREIFNMK